MMHKERLEEIKKELELDWYDISYVVNQDDVKWLINRVEELEEERDEWKDTVEELEEERDEWRDTAQSYYITNQELREQNKRYKRALEFYAGKENYFLKQRKTSSFYTPIELDKGEKARQALEGKE